MMLIGPAFTQTTGLLEDFNDNVLSGWEVPADQTAGTFALTEADSVLRIDYNRTAQSYEWDNFNYTPPSIIDATNNPYITVRAKSDVGTALTFKPIYENGDHDWVQVTLLSDEVWHTYKFELVATKPYQINRIYMYLDGGSTETRSGVVYFDDMRIGDSVRTVDVLDLNELERLISDANKLHANGVEGTGEGAFAPGSKVVLKNAISEAEQFIAGEDMTNEQVDSTIWVLADACVTFESGVNAADIGLIDPLATKETKYLYINLGDLSGNFLLFGMHDATGYGVGWTGDDDRSDVKAVCGSYPAVYSEDINKVDRNNQVERMRYRLTSAYNRGGVITLSWHQYDPEGRSFYSKYTGGDNVVESMLPGGEYHQFYKERLYKIGRFLKTLRGANGESVPVIFRPYHEHTGGWFWWGAGQCSTDEYNRIWQFTVEYLRDSLNVHNLIYALSPSAQHLSSKDDYYNIYPGDDYIDIFGFDNYFSLNITSAEKEELKNDLRRIAQAAVDKGKIPAMTEIGQENVVTSNLFTGYILDPVKTDSLTRQFAYAAVWRNQDTGHHFAPYPGHPSVPDFVKFYNDAYTIFEDNLPEMYVLTGDDQTPPEVIDYPAESFTAFETDVTIEIKTNERAFLRYGFSDMAYAELPHEFRIGQGGFDHSTVISGNQGEDFHLFIRAADYNGNAMMQSVEVEFTIDTLQRPVAWNEKHYDVSDWRKGSAPIHFENGSQEGSVASYSRTVYLRKSFDVENLDSLFQMVAFVKYDNGFVLYINGHEIRRINMPDGHIGYETWAGGSSQNSINVTLDASVLALMNNGQNVIALEVHQSAADSNDFNFDLQMIDPEIVIAYGSEWYFYAEGKEPEIKPLGATEIEEIAAKPPAQTNLAQNFPNPFNPTTTIQYALSDAGPVELTVYNMLGQKLAVLVSKKQAPGRYAVEWNAADAASGVYFYRLQTVRGAVVRKMILIR